MSELVIKTALENGDLDKSFFKDNKMTEQEYIEFDTKFYSLVYLFSQYDINEDKENFETYCRLRNETEDLINKLRGIKKDYDKLPIWKGGE